MAVLNSNDFRFVINNLQTPEETTCYYSNDKCYVQFRLSKDTNLDHYVKRVNKSFTISVDFLDKPYINNQQFILTKVSAMFKMENTVQCTLLFKK